MTRIGNFEHTTSCQKADQTDHDRTIPLTRDMSVVRCHPSWRKVTLVVVEVIHVAKSHSSCRKSAARSAETRCAPGKFDDHAIAPSYWRGVLLPGTTAKSEDASSDSSYGVMSGAGPSIGTPRGHRLDAPGGCQSCGRRQNGPSPGMWFRGDRHGGRRRTGNREQHCQMT